MSIISLLRSLKPRLELEPLVCHGCNTNGAWSQCGPLWIFAFSKKTLANPFSFERRPWMAVVFLVRWTPCGLRLFLELRQGLKLQSLHFEDDAKTTTGRICKVAGVCLCFWTILFHPGDFEECPFERSDFWDRWGTTHQWLMHPIWSAQVYYDALVGQCGFGHRCCYRHCHLDWNCGLQLRCNLIVIPMLGFVSSKSIIFRGSSAGSAYMYIYMCVYVCIYIYVCVYIYIYMYIYTYIYTYVLVRMFVWESVCVCGCGCWAHYRYDRKSQRISAIVGENAGVSKELQVRLRMSNGAINLDMIWVSMVGRH